MPTNSAGNAPQILQAEINAAAVQLVSVGLVDDYNMATIQRGPEHVVVTSPVPVDSSVIKSKPYATLYQEQVEKGAYNLRFLDGAIAQLSYRFEEGSLITHRLAFLPSPDLEPYQTDPELYISDVPYLDVVGYQVVSVPIRFDFDIRPDVAGAGHPASHVTLGQYKHCRIPSTGPVTPNNFLNFIVQNFYSGGSIDPTVFSSSLADGFTPSITEIERSGTHIAIPHY